MLDEADELISVECYSIWTHLYQPQLLQFGQRCGNSSAVQTEYFTDSFLADEDGLLHKRSPHLLSIFICQKYEDDFVRRGFYQLKDGFII